jgi:uncharacterized cysteine cluster protein YcgN (CxxCxxCC family)
MDLTKMSYDELDTLIKNAITIRNQKIKKQKDEDWTDFEKAWNKIFTGNEFVDGCDECTQTILDQLKDAFYDY